MRRGRRSDNLRRTRRAEYVEYWSHVRHSSDLLRRHYFLWIRHEQISLSYGSGRCSTLCVEKKAPFASRLLGRISEIILILLSSGKVAPISGKFLWTPGLARAPPRDGEEASLSLGSWIRSGQQLLYLPSEKIATGEGLCTPKTALAAGSAYDLPRGI